MKYNGHGTISIEGKIQRCSVELDLIVGRIVVVFPSSERNFGRQLDFRKKYSINDLYFTLPTALIESGSIRNLKLSDQGMLSTSIYNSDLVRAFSLYKTDVGICKLVFYPTRKYISLEVKHFERDASLNNSRI